VPRPRPLSIRTVQEEKADHLLLFEELLLRRMQESRHITGWPGFVLREFAAYPPGEQLKAIALPLVMSDPPFAVQMNGRTFAGDLKEFSVELNDFDISWEAAHAG
jgi:hypothetical protein